VLYSQIDRYLEAMTQRQLAQYYKGVQAYLKR
jgi:hypothetical protein